MPYVPPHKRNESVGDSSAPAERLPSMDRASSLKDRPSSLSGSNSYGRGGGSFRRNDSYEFNRSNSDSLGRTGSSQDLKSLEPVFASWQPSARVQALTETQTIDIRQRLNVTVDVEPDQPPPLAPIECFEDMNLHPNIITDIAFHKYEKPTPIQCQGIPIGLCGRDILGCAETGSGKTASFVIPMVQHCLNQPPLRSGQGPIGLVLAPTRELAQQIEKEVKAFSITSKLKTTIVVGGVQISEQKYDLRNGVEIVVATPGRFIDHLHQGNTSLNRVSFIVLDEADRMLDMGFEPQIKEVMDRLPARHQTLLFSATMPVEIETLAKTYLQHPVTIKVGAVSTPTANVSQHIERCNEQNKVELLAALLHEEMSVAEKSGAPMPLTIVFVERKMRCDEVAHALLCDSIQATALHGGLTQQQREGALRDFSAGTVKVLVATDVASRGLDIKGIGHVVNMDLPKTFEDYVHRIGRTGRAGQRGRATSFYTEKDSFLVSQIRSALSELEAGNTFAFATGKAARQQERQLAQKFKSDMKIAAQGIVQSSGAAVKVDDRYSHMVSGSAMQSVGSADAAWDD